MVPTLRRVAEGNLLRDAETLGVDLKLTLSVYNFWFWFDGSKAVLFLDDQRECVALVWVDGRYEVYCVEENLVDEALRRLVHVLGLREDATEFFQLASRDPLLNAFAEKFRGWRLRASSLWWALVVGICQQNASFRQGWSMLENLVLRYGRRVALGSVEVLAPPTPRDVVEKPGILIDARVGYRAKTIEAVARALVEGSLDPRSLGSRSFEEIENELKRFRGIGSYTARLATALAFRRYDLPPVDRWVRAIASRVYGVEERLVEAEWRKRWGRWSALAVIALTIALDAAPLRKALERIERRALLPDPSAIPSPTTLWMWRRS